MHIILVFYEDLVNRFPRPGEFLRIWNPGLGNERNTAQSDGCQASDQSKLHPDPPNCIDQRLLAKIEPKEKQIVITPEADMRGHYVAFCIMGRIVKGVSCAPQWRKTTLHRETVDE